MIKYLKNYGILETELLQIRREMNRYIILEKGDTLTVGFKIDEGVASIRVENLDIPNVLIDENISSKKWEVESLDLEKEKKKLKKKQEKLSKEYSLDVSMLNMEDWKQMDIKTGDILIKFYKEEIEQMTREIKKLERGTS